MKRHYWYRPWINEDAKASTAAAILELRGKWELIWKQKQPKRREVFLPMRNQVPGTLSEPLDYAASEASCLPPELSVTRPNVLHPGLERVGSDFLSSACARVLLDPNILCCPALLPYSNMKAFILIYSFPECASHLAISVFLECFPSFPFPLTRIIKLQL